MQGRQHQSPSRLLQLPAELLDKTIDFFEEDKKTLANLALVNRVCLCLARVRQFKEIHFDYSPQSHELVESLENKNKTKFSFPIGIFVRKFTFAPLMDFLYTAHPDLFKAVYNNIPPSPQPQEIIDKLLITAQEYYVDQRKSILTVIASKLPNLTVLVWKDGIQLDSDFIEAISRCSAEHVKLESIRISKDWPMETPAASTRWNLRTLDLNVNLMASAYRSGVNADLGDPPTMAMDHPTSVFLDTLFQRCSSTLESLTWWHTGRLIEDLRVTLDRSKLTFPNLQHLSLEHLYFEPKSFSAFMSLSLRHLALPERSFDLISESLEACESLPYLQTLVVPEMPSTRERCMPIANFIKRHNHIQNLYLSEEGSIDSRDGQMSSLIIPNLANGMFNNLRCLSLSWVKEMLPPNSKVYKDTFPEQSLVALSTIGSLEQLSLRFGPVCCWLIDHDKLRRHLKSLNRLKKLALLHDTYHRSELKYIGPVEYYERRCLLDSDRKDAARLTPDADEDYEYESDETAESYPGFSEYEDSDESDDCTWERAHRYRMLMQAEAYAEVFPDLERIYCGQRPMGLRHHPDRKKAFPLSKGRVNDRAFLDKTLGSRNEKQAVGA
ncbi:hypothetical protein HDV63DRAFT_413005 [Trichoderma sp. SZMC 28014]